MTTESKSLRKRLFSRSDAHPAPLGARSDAGMFRTDAQYSGLGGDSVGKTKPTTYVDYLVRNGIRDHESKDHRNLVAEFDPHAKLWVHDIAWNVWDDWFDFTDPDDQPLPEMQVVQDEFKRLRLKEVLFRATMEERKHGWAIVYKVYSGARNRIVNSPEADWTHFMGDAYAFSDTPVEPGRPIVSVQPLPTSDLQVMECDRFNQPTILLYTPTISSESQPMHSAQYSIRIHASRCWWLNPRPKDRSWQGYTALASIWSVLVAMREHLDNMAWYAGKFGAGMLVARKKGPTDDAIADALDTAMQNVSKRRHLQINTNAYEDIKWEVPDLPGSGFMDQIEACYGMLSAGTGLPKTRWYGAQAGDLQGSRTNLKLEWGVISAIQASYEPILRAIVEDLFPQQFTDYKIQWKIQGQMDDMERAQLDSLRADMVQKLGTVATRTELRERAGFKGEPEGPTLAEEQQEAILKLAEKTGGGTGRPGQSPRANAERPPPTRPTRSDAQAAIRAGTFPQFVQFWETKDDPDTGRRWTRDSLGRECGLSSATVYRHLPQEARRHDLRI